VVIYAHRLRSFGQWLIYKHDDIDVLASYLRQIKLTPGSLPGGPDLKLRFDIRRGELEGITTLLANKLIQIGRQLVYLADKYEYTEDIQKGDMERLEDVLNAVTTGWTLPEVTPPEDPTTDGSKEEPKKEEETKK